MPPGLYAGGAPGGAVLSRLRQTGHLPAGDGAGILICSLYNVASFRRLCSAISENPAYRWFCFLTIDDPVFDHSTISYFIERVGREGFAAIFRGLNEELLRLGLLSPEMYADASLVKANAGSFGLVSSGITVTEFEELTVEENGLFVLTETGASQSRVDSEEVRYFQDSKGRLPLNPVDTDARWRTSSSKRPAELCYQDNVIVDLGGFIVARGVTHASQGEWKAVPRLLEQVPIHPVSLTMDTGYSTGELRQILEDRGTKAYIPLRPVQEDTLVGPGRFMYQGDRLICPRGKTLHRRGFNKKGTALHVHGTARRLPGVSDQRRLSSATTETQIRIADPVLPGDDISQGKKPDQ